MWRKRIIPFLILGLLVLMAAGARAAERKFSLAVQADGVTLGTAAATLTVTDADQGKVTWKLSDGVFTEQVNPDGKLKWADDMMTGSGTAKSTDTVALKDFDITVQQSTGVDVAYRFRLTAELADGAIKSISIDQVK